MITLVGFLVEMMAGGGVLVFTAADASKGRPDLFDGDLLAGVLFFFSRGVILLLTDLETPYHSMSGSVWSHFCLLAGPGEDLF